MHLRTPGHGGKPVSDRPTETKAAVILLAYGGPDSLDDIPAYLLDIRGGRPTPQHLVDEIAERYRLIGGRSPLLAITRDVAGKLEQRIGRPVYVGMRHWSPTIGDVVGRMAADGIRQVTAICMAPHYSELSIGKYRQALEKAVATVTPSGGSNDFIDVNFIESWHTQPDYLQAVAGNVRATLERWPATGRERVLVIFTAHSLPASILAQGDPYDAQLRQTAALLAEQLDLPAERWTFSYQSAAQTGVPWLGPQIEDLVVELAKAGWKDLLVAPLGFIADHVEVLYDIDIGVQEIARACGVRLERPPMLNSDDRLVDALAALVNQNG